MTVGGVNFVAWTILSDAYENIATLLSHTYFYDGNGHGTLSVQEGIGEELDLTPERFKELATIYPHNTDDERITYFYEKLCREKGLMLITYEQLERLEELVNGHNQ